MTEYEERQMAGNAKLTKADKENVALRAFVAKFREWLRVSEFRGGPLFQEVIEALQKTPYEDDAVRQVHRRKG